MATSVLDLLDALDVQLDQLEATRLIPGAAPRVQQEWHALAQASRRLLANCPRPLVASDSGRRFVLLLESMAAPAGARPLPSPGTGLIDVTRVVGGIADLLSTPLTTTDRLRQLTREALTTNLQCALARSASWTIRNVRQFEAAHDPQLARLAGFDAAPVRPAALHSWRLIGPSDPGLDGAVARWTTAASEAVSNPNLVTQHALQLAAADIAMISAAAAATVERAGQVAALEPDLATTPASALGEAGRSWRRAAIWPDHIRLGGRSTDLRHASAQLRQAITDELRTAGAWKPTEEMFAEASPEQRLAVACSSLQAARSVGREVTSALHQLTHGSTRAWLDASHIPMPTHSVQKALDSLRWTWLPDPDTYHSAEPLLQAATEAQKRLAQALNLTIDAYPRPRPRPTVEPDGSVDEVWEIVPVPTNPLSLAQERARLAPAAISESPGRAIGL
jgi:hypothetical protein